MGTRKLARTAIGGGNYGESRRTPGRVNCLFEGSFLFTISMFQQLIRGIIYQTIAVCNVIKQRT